MLRIGKLTDYALLIMSQVAKEPGVILSAASLAETLHLGVPTVSKILKILSDATLVYSIRGAEGGYRLGRDAKDITVGDIIGAMEGEVAMTQCCEHPSPCTIETLCLMRDNWIKINNKIKNLLHEVTLADMLKPLSSPIFKRGA